METHFRAFSFVDRITSIAEGRHIGGCYTVPAGLSEFPLALVGEAVGQLAAWAAMAAVGFSHRPVAGLAGRLELLREPRPGQEIALSADLESVDAESVQYHGIAQVDGTPIVRLVDCVGPMMPLAEFDDPAALRARFQQLCHANGGGGGFPGLPQMGLGDIAGDPGQGMSASFQVPADAPLFGDHFPRRAVFPGSLLMHISLQLGAALAARIPPPGKGAWVPATIQDMKLRTFIPPGAALGLKARLKQQARDSACLSLETRAGGEVIATASLQLRPGGSA